MKYNDNGEYKDIYIKTFDTLPVGAEVDYDGETIPDGWTEVESYSTSEVKTGQNWIDGKPIYRKVCTTTSVTLGSQATLETISNVKEVVKISSIAINSSGFTAPIPTFWGTDLTNQNNKIWVDVGSSNTSIKYQFNSWWSDIVKLTTIIEYTKN